MNHPTHKINLFERSALRLSLAKQGISFKETKGLWSSIFEIDHYPPVSIKRLRANGVWYRRLHTWATVD